MAADELVDMRVRLIGDAFAGLPAVHIAIVARRWRNCTQDRALDAFTAARPRKETMQ